MRGDSIPLETWYRQVDGKITTFKKPKYVLMSKQEAAEKQKKLGNLLEYYYGTKCDKCCGVYPMIVNEGGFRDFCYFVCPVCGKESKHNPMTWQSREAWNKGAYEWTPDKLEENYQYTIFDFMD